MNYLFFFPDEMRASALSCYGNSYVKTPNFDRLAAMGTVFEGNYTPHPVCVASRCSLMTGWYPHVAGFRSLENVMQSHHPNFLKTIHAGGFSTHLYGKNHAPYCITETFYNSVDPDTLPPVLPPDLAGKPLFQKLIRQYRGLEQVPAKVFQKVQAVYYCLRPL